MSATPYVGPRPFTLGDRERFFGRDDEVDELVSLVIAHPVVLIYALSGVGKSSLVNAGLVPMLREEGYAALPPARVEGVVPAGVDPAGVGNRFVFHALSCWLDVQEVPFCAAEEVAGLRVSEFVKAWMASRPAEFEEAAPVLVFDQFEEIFTGAESRWKERDDFFVQLGEALEAQHRLKVVFALREEFIARLEPFAKYFPRQLRVRKRLERLGEHAALTAIRRPVEEFGLRYEAGVAEKLVHDLMGVGEGEALGESIEPVQLQVVCLNLWEKLPAEFKTPGGAGDRLITAEHLRAAGEVTTALSNYYNEAIHAAVETSGVREGRLRRWFGETLIASDHSSLGLAVKGHSETAAIPVGAIRVLQERYLIRHEKRGAAEWYELAHARFIEPILKSNGAWLELHRGPEAIRQKLQQQAEELNRSGGSLEAWELGQAEDFLRSPEAGELDDHAAIESLVQRSREHFATTLLQAKKERSLRRQRVAVCVLGSMVVAVVLGYWRVRELGDDARARELAFRALDDIRNDPERALLLAIHGFSTRPSDAGLNVLHQTLAASPIRLLLAGEGGHSLAVNACVFAEKGTEILTGGLDRRVRVWNATDGKFKSLVGEDDQQGAGPIVALALSVDGNQLAIGASDGEVRLWPYPKPAEGAWPAPRVFTHFVATGREHTDLRSVAFDRTGTRLIVSYNDGAARIWDTASGRTVLRLEGRGKVVRAASFSPTENLAVTADKDGTARIWDLDAAPETPGEEEPEVPVLRTPQATLSFASEGDVALWDAQFSPNGTRLVTAGGDHVAWIWDVHTGAELVALDAHFGPILQAKFIDETHVATVSTDKTARVWRLRREERVRPALAASRNAEPGPERVLVAVPEAVLRGHTDFVRGVAVSPDGQSLVTASRDRTARVWTLARGCEAMTTALTGIVWDAAFSPDGHAFVVAATKTPTILDAKTAGAKGRVTPLVGHQAVVRQVAYRPDGKALATADAMGMVKIWKADSGEEMTTLPDKLFSVAYDPTGRYLAGITDENSARILDLEGGPPVTLRGHSDRVMAVSFSPDGTALVTASMDENVRLWERQSGAPLAIFPVENGDAAINAAFSPDGKWIVGAWSDGRATLWKIDLPSLIEKMRQRGAHPLEIPNPPPPPDGELRGHEGQVRNARFFRYQPHYPASKDEVKHGRLSLITAGFDGKVRTWEENPRTHQWTAAYDLPGAELPVYAIAVSPDGTEIVTGGADREVRVYYTDGDTLRSLAETRVTRKLTADERKNFGIPPVEKDHQRVGE
jgi:WD40 repeat protein